MNASAVLNAMRSRGAVTGSDLMEATGLSRPTVHAVCDHLIEQGWVNELKTQRPARGSQPGRRARRYEFNAGAGYVLAVDLGAHTVTALLADLRGETVSEVAREVAAQPAPASELFKHARAAARAALKAARVDTANVLQVALGVPAPVRPDGRAGVPNLDVSGLAHTDLTAPFRRGFGWPVVAENDANLAVIGERWRGAAAGVDNAIVLLAGERLGAGLILNGRLIRGANGGAGEMRFVKLIEGILRPGSGIGDRARLLGAEAVARARSQNPGSSSRPAGRSLFDLAEGDPARVTAELLFDAVRAGDPVATDILDRITATIARPIAMLATLLDPELIVIAGAPAHAGDLLLKPLEEHARDLLLGELATPPPRLAASTLGNHAVLTGAVRLALDHVESRLLQPLNTSDAPSAKAT